MRRRRCGAKTHDGKICYAAPVAGRGRCRLHGGASTGPKTADGRKRLGDLARARYVAQALADGWIVAEPALSEAVAELKRRFNGMHNTTARALRVTGHAVRRVLTGLPLRPEEHETIRARIGRALGLP
jgi:hypothetical protein